MQSVTTSIPKSYVPAAEQEPNFYGFYKSEYMTLTFGEYSGRPSDFIDFHKSDLVYFLADGWKVDAVLAKGHGGKWTVEARALSEQKSTGSTTDQDADVDSPAQSSSTSHAAGATANTQEGGPYWFVWSKIRLVRKRLQGDRVTKWMTERLVASYNEGRRFNSDRYDELCRMYLAMTQSTQGYVNGTSAASALPGAMLELENGFAERMRAIPLPETDELASVSVKMDDRMMQWLDSRMADINRQFDARLEQTKSQMVSNGTYNSVVWPGVASGIERDRQYALNDLNSALTDLESSLAGIKARLFEAKVSLYDAQQKRETGIIEVRMAIRNAAAKLTDDILKNRLDLLTIRNNTAKAMFDFMERREDDYPDLDTVLDAVSRLDNESVDPGSSNMMASAPEDTQTVLPNPTLPPLPSVDRTLEGGPVTAPTTTAATVLS